MAQAYRNSPLDLAAQTMIFDADLSGDFYDFY